MRANLVRLYRINSAFSIGAASLAFGCALAAPAAAQSVGITINGTGGFATPGRNLALSYQRRFRNGSTLFIEYGSPAAASTLQRTIVKYVLLIGPGAGE